MRCCDFTSVPQSTRFNWRLCAKSSPEKHSGPEKHSLISVDLKTDKGKDQRHNTDGYCSLSIEKHLHHSQYTTLLSIHSQHWHYTQQQEYQPIQLCRLVSTVYVFILLFDIGMSQRSEKIKTWKNRLYISESTVPTKTGRARGIYTLVLCQLGSSISIMTDKRWTSCTRHNWIF